MAETETPKKGGKGKKEKKAKAPKPKKEKKPKAPKPKKEKKPKKGKGAGGEDGESTGKRGPNKKLLILLIGIVLLMGIAAFLVIKVFKLFPSLVPEEDPTPTETVEAGEGEEPGEDAEPGEDEEPAGDADAEGEPAGGEAAPPEETEDTPETEQRYPAEIHTQITNAQVMEFIESLSPSLLGLEGEDMSDYEMFASDNVSIIDGIYCTQVRVYSKNPSAGTNDIEGIYFVTRGNARHLYRYDEFTETVTEIPLN